MKSETTPTVLYRHYDKAGKLLYVGISLSAAQRLEQHMRAAGWAGEIAQVTIERFSNRQLALDAERAAICAEQPCWNVVHRNKPAASHGTLAKSKKAREQPTFDVMEVPRTIRAITFELYKLARLSTHLTFDYGPSQAKEWFVEVSMQMRAGLHKSEVNVLKLFQMGGFEIKPNSFRRMVMTVTEPVDENEVDEVSITICSPAMLESICREYLGSSPDYDRVFMAEILPAVEEYKQLFGKLASGDFRVLPVASALGQQISALPILKVVRTM